MLDENESSPSKLYIVGNNYETRIFEHWCRVIVKVNMKHCTPWVIACFMDPDGGMVVDIYCITLYQCKLLMQSCCWWRKYSCIGPRWCVLTLATGHRSNQSTSQSYRSFLCSWTGQGSWLPVSQSSPCLIGQVTYHFWLMTLLIC